MFCLSRQVRFAVNSAPDEQWQLAPTNSYGGYPTLRGVGRYFSAVISLCGELNPITQYMVNIKAIDQKLRDALSRMNLVHTPPPEILRMIFEQSQRDWGERLQSVCLNVTPFFSIMIQTREQPMMRLSQKFEFSASHRLHNPKMTDAENRSTFGKCNNPSGHGHNYEVQVTLLGKPEEKSGLLIDVPAFERIVADTVIEPFDHKNLNTEVPQFRELIPSVENIAKVIYGLLALKLKSDHCKLASVTVWETPKTWCEYSE
jgi:6-pyruvoyltetrahydropterin/6-carboxytetrahydropterin synthase